MGSETNFFVAIPYNGRTELTSYTRDRKVRRLRTGELSTHTEREKDRGYRELESKKFTETEIPAHGPAEQIAEPVQCEGTESEGCPRMGCSSTAPT